MSKLKSIVESHVFQNIILGIIILNSIILGLQTSSGIMAFAGTALSIADNVCLGIFILEMLLKLIVYRLDYFKDAWNWFDMIIIITSVFSGLAFLSALRVFRVFRVFRSLKALRSLKMVSNLRPLQIIIQAIGRAIPSISWTVVLMALIYYIFSIIGVTMFGQAFPEWFGTIPRAMYTLFQVMTLESWSMGISRPVMEVFPEAWLYFVPFVLISSFIVMNVVVGIVVNSISEVTEISKKPDPEETNDSKETTISEEIAAVREHLAKLEEMLAQTNADK